jgi:hypothetical protein
MYSGITTIYYRKTVGHVFFIVVQISAARIIAAVKYINAPMLTRVWQELEYRIDVCRVTRGAHIECKKKTPFSVLLWFRKYLSYGFPIINSCNPGVHYETPCMFKKVRSKPTAVYHNSLLLHSFAFFFIGPLSAARHFTLPPVCTFHHFCRMLCLNLWGRQLKFGVTCNCVSVWFFWNSVQPTFILLR